MPCSNPLRAFRTLDGGVVFHESQRHDTVSEIYLACGQCWRCRLERSRQWAVRCMHENQMHEKSCFITLTYNDEKLPTAGSLRYEHFQGFMRRLRKHLARIHRKSKEKPTKGTPPCTWSAETNRDINIPEKRKIRFYMCGEYGERTQRAHYHALIYGFDFPDKKHFRNTAAGPLYTSALLEKLWGKGNTSIGAVTFESAAYVARYIMKKQLGKNSKKHYEKLDIETGEILIKTPEFTHMSLKPGIGLPWLRRYTADVYPSGHVVVRNQQSKTPKYYDKKYKEWEPLKYEDLLFERDKEAKKRPDEYKPHRLAAKEKVAIARSQIFHPRPLE